jgi:uncharacterized membrane protein
VNIRWARRLQFAAACGLIAAYAGFSHYCNTAGVEHDWGAVLALTPLTLVLTILIWRALHPAVAACLMSALGGALWGLWPLLKLHYSVFFLIQESTIYTLLGLAFGRTLLPGRVALCTQLADKVHGPLSPRELWYTRRVTAAWAAFFFAVTMVSLLLYALAPLRIWSAFINFCVLPLVVTLFLVETMVVRRRVLPQVKGSGLLDTVRVYLATPH